MDKNNNNNRRENQVKKLDKGNEKHAFPLIRCPKCSFPLVLYEHNKQYKCTWCGRLFPQKELEHEFFLNYRRKWKEEKAAKIAAMDEAKKKELLKARLRKYNKLLAENKVSAGKSSNEKI
jgi:DNA-directed RNA polymerase subunit RPC12/RpoP